MRCRRCFSVQDLSALATRLTPSPLRGGVREGGCVPRAYATLEDTSNDHRPLHPHHRLRRCHRGPCRRADGARPGDRRRRPRAQHEARLRGGARRCSDAIAAKPLPEALKAIGTKLVMTVGGASGPLYGTLFLTLGKELAAEPDRAHARRRACARPSMRSRRAANRSPGRRRMLDVLYPVAGCAALAERTADDHRRCGRCGGRCHHAGEGDPRPRLLPRRPLDRPYGCRARARPRFSFAPSRDASETAA